MESTATASQGRSSAKERIAQPSRDKAVPEPSLPVANPNVLEVLSAPSVEGFTAMGRRRGGILTLVAVLASLILGALFIVQGLDSPLLPLVALTMVATPIVLWYLPRTTLSIILGGTCLFECVVGSFGYADSLTDRVPFFWNINTIVQVYGGMNFKAMPFNLVDAIFMLAGVTSLFRAVYNRNVSIYRGTLLKFILPYLAFVCLGWMNGMATGGDYKEALTEVHGQFFFLFAYLMTTNLVVERKQEKQLLTLALICIGIKGVLLTFRKYVTLSGVAISDQGVGAHDEVFFFDFFIIAVLVLGIFKGYPRLKTLSWYLLPTVLLAHFACNRRAGTAAVIIAVPIILMVAYASLPKRRRVIAIVSMVLAVTGFSYYQAFKYSDKSFAQPARAVRSQFAPDARDAGSNAYRDAESMDQMATIRSSPIIGYGYGKRFIHAVPIADISELYEWWDLLPHNQVLWVWMRVGTPGYVAFWLMMAAIIIRACQIARRQEVDAETRTLCVLALATVVMLLMFGLLDMQLADARDLLFTGVMVGLIDTRLYAKTLLPKQEAKRLEAQ